MTKLYALITFAGILSAQTVANLDPQPQRVQVTVAVPQPAATKLESSPIKRATVKGIISASSIQVDHAGNTEYLQLACIDTASGAEGTTALRHLTEGKLIEYSQVDKDTVEVGVDGVNVNLRLLSRGLAKLTVSEQCQQNKDYRAAADEAQSVRAGIHAEPVREVEYDVTRFAPDTPLRPSLGKMLLGAAVSGLAEGLIESAVQRSFAPSNDVYVRGYTRKNGTYVAPYHRTRANGTKSDNYSTKGNVNPHTGKRGTK